MLANKQLRWWWNNHHQAVYDNGDGTGWSPHGPNTAWVPNSKSITFAEYGFPACDKGTNQPNVFYDPKSVESFTPYWSMWDPSESVAGDYWPRRDERLYLLALQAVYEYWVTDGNNATVGGVGMIEPTFMSVWNWDARPFPTFPNRVDVWGDTGNWRAGEWFGGKGPFIALPLPDNPPALGSYPTFPAVPTRGWSVRYSPVFSTGAAMHVSGREVRAAKYAAPNWSIEVNFDLLRMAAPNTELQTIVGFFEQCLGEGLPFLFEPVPLSPVSAQPIGTGDGSTTTFYFGASIGNATITPATVSVSAVYLDGVLQSTGYSVSTAAFATAVTFTHAPSAGVAVTADFGWYFLCRFDDDSEYAEEFMSELYALQSLRLRTVRS
ncbi:MAG: baseplate megatron protein TIM-barrel domain-containing protein [Bradyrhizobium sp.]